MTSSEINAIIRSEEYKKYIKALSRLSFDYVSRIRVKFAEQAFEKYQDESIRRLVLAYGEQIEKLEAHHLDDFSRIAEHVAIGIDDHHDNDSLEDWCLNSAKHYAEAIKLFFLK